MHVDDFILDIDISAFSFIQLRIQDKYFFISEFIHFQQIFATISEITQVQFLSRFFLQSSITLLPDPTICSISHLNFENSSYLFVTITYCFRFGHFRLPMKYLYDQDRNLGLIFNDLTRVPFYFKLIIDP